MSKLGRKPCDLIRTECLGVGGKINYLTKNQDDPVNLAEVRSAPLHESATALSYQGKHPLDRTGNRRAVDDQVFVGKFEQRKCPYRFGEIIKLRCFWGIKYGGGEISDRRKQASGREVDERHKFKNNFEGSQFGDGSAFTFKSPFLLMLTVGYRKCAKYCSDRTDCLHPACPLSCVEAKVPAQDYQIDRKAKNQQRNKCWRAVQKAEKFFHGAILA